MQRINVNQPTQYPPLEQGQVLEMNDHCMKVNYGFKFIRGVMSGLVLAIICFHFVGELILFGEGIQTTIDFIMFHSALFPYIGIVALLELYLWPSAPP